MEYLQTGTLRTSEVPRDVCGHPWSRLIQGTKPNCREIRIWFCSGPEFLRHIIFFLPGALKCPKSRVINVFPPLILRQERKCDGSYKHFYMIYYDSHHRGYLWSKRLVGFELGYLQSMMTTWAWKAWILALLCCHSRTYILLIHINSLLSF